MERAELVTREPMEMSSAQCVQFLDGHRVGRVAFITPMGPRIVPVGYTFDGTVIVFETAPYSVLGTYGRGHEVAFEVDEFDIDQRWGCSVVARGIAERADVPCSGGDSPLSWLSGPRCIRVRLEPRDLTGRCVRAAPRTGHRPFIPAQRATSAGREVVAQVRLRDGTEAIICPLLHRDREAVRDAYEHLSPLSRFHRFMAPVEHLTKTMLDHLVDEVDGIDHVALLLFVRPTDGREVAVGVARVARYPDEPTAADVAVTVADDWQGKGVASTLLPALMRRRPAGVTTLVTEVYYDNPASLAMLRHLGRTRVTPDGCGGLEVEVDLQDGPFRHPQSGNGVVNRQVGR